MKRNYLSDLKLKDFKIEHEFKASKERFWDNSFFGLLFLREIQH